MGGWNQPRGEQAKERIRKAQGANKPGGESAKGRTNQRANKPGGEPSKRRKYNWHKTASGTSGVYWAP